MNCFFRDIFDIYCAGCGGTRMIISIFKLDFYQAFRYNPLMFIVLILGVIFIIYNIILKAIGKKLFIPKLKWWILLYIILVIYMILRNIPGFEFLLPTDV